MECKKCGFKNKIGNSYCTQCGEKLTSEERLTDNKLKVIVIVIGVLIFCLMLLELIVKRNDVEDNNSNINNDKQQNKEEDYVSPLAKITYLVNDKLRSYQHIANIKEDTQTKNFIIEITYYGLTSDDFYDCAKAANLLSKDLIGNQNIKEIDFTCRVNGEIKYIKYTDLSNESNFENNIFYYDADGNNIKTSLEKLLNDRVNDYKKKCQKFSYKDVLRYPNNYDGKYAFWYGEIVQVVSKSSSKSIFRVNVNCEKLHYSGGYLCSDAIYVIYYGSESFIEDDMVNMWGMMTGDYTYTTVLGSENTIPKFEAHYMELK